MMGWGMSVDQAKEAILSDVETNFVAAGLLDDTPQQKPGLRVIYVSCFSHAARLCDWLAKCYNIWGTSTDLIVCCQVIREMIKPPDSKWKQLFGGDTNLGRLSITAAEFRELVPQKELQVCCCCTSPLPITGVLILPTLIATSTATKFCSSTVHFPTGQATQQVGGL